MSRRIQFKVIALVLVLALVISLSACQFYIPKPKPEGGIWYCEELMLEIDFGAYHEAQTQHCAKKYNPDGTYQDVLLRIDYGHGLNICSEDGQEDYLAGSYRYKNGIFYVISYQDEVTYIFERIDTTPSSSQMAVRHLNAA